MADTATLSMAERKKLFAAGADKPAAKPVATKQVAIAKAAPHPAETVPVDAPISASAPGSLGLAKPKAAVKAPAGFASFSPLKSTPKLAPPSTEPATEPKPPALKATAKPVAIAAPTPEKAAAKPSPLKAFAKPVAAVPADPAPMAELKPTAKAMAVSLKPKAAPVAVTPTAATPEHKPISAAVSPLIKVVAKPVPAIAIEKTPDSPAPSTPKKSTAAMSLPKLPHTSGGKLDEPPPSPRLKSPRFSRETELLKWAGEDDELSVNHLPAGSGEDLPPAPPPMPPPAILAQMTAAAGLPPPPPPPSDVPPSPRSAAATKLGRAPAPPTEALLDVNTKPGSSSGSGSSVSKGPVAGLERAGSAAAKAAAKAATIVTKLPEKEKPAERVVESPAVVVQTPADVGDKRNRRRAFKMDPNALGDELPPPAATPATRHSVDHALRTASDAIDTHNVPAVEDPVPEVPATDEPAPEVDEPVELTDEADEHDHSEECDPNTEPAAEDAPMDAMAALDEIVGKARPRLDNNVALNKVSGPRKGKRRPPKKKRPADAIAVERAPEKKEIPEEEDENSAKRAAARPYASAYAGAPPGGMALPGMGGPMGLKMPAFDPSAIKSKLKSSAPATGDGAKKPPASTPAMVMPALKPTAKGLNKTMS